jgi:carboxymethylenebutenolidase
MIGKLDPAQTLDNAVAAVKALRDRKDTTDHIGAMGFCWGGGLIGKLAEADPTLTAGVIYYGMPPDLAKVPDIKAALLMHYAGLDERINANVPAFREALDKAGRKYDAYTYDGVNHAFNNDTSAARYDEKAAKLAWTRTMDFFGKHLTG